MGPRSYSRNSSSLPLKKRLQRNASLHENMPKKIIDVKAIREILAQPFAEDDWLVEGLIHNDTVTVLSGQPASFKTWVTIHLALCLAGKKPFLGHFNVPDERHVLILDKENHPKHVQKRLRALDASSDVLVWYNFDHDLQLDNDDHMDALMSFAEEEGIGLVIIDSLIRFHRGDENDARQMSAVLQNLRKLTTIGTNVLFTHHHRKESAFGSTTSSSLRGSSDIFAAVDCHIALEHKKRESMITLSHLKSRQSPALDQFAARIVTDETSGSLALEYVGEYDSHQIKTKEAKEECIAIFDGRTDELALKDIETLLEGMHGKSVLNKALFEMVEEGLLIKRVRQHNKAFYSRPKNEVEESDV